ncbi:MAG: glycosyltransferase [Deltaproteobacteria bacterium]|nr:glycosyltransferase [Deltaproteobacteria bacterium]
MVQQAAVAPTGSTNRRRVLFIAEAVTLAHVGRAYALARALDPNLYEVHLAADPRFERLFDQAGLRWHRCHSISTERFLRCVRAGKPFLDVTTLREYVHNDMALMDTIRPDIVIGDFRLSLSISARVRGIPYVSIFNAYWSPHATPRYIVPDVPVVDVFGPTIGQFFFSALRRTFFAWYCHAINRVRRDYGLQSISSNLLRVYTDGDITLYADLPQLVPTHNLPANHRFIGPVLWSPQVPLPSWWHDMLRDERPLVYISLGSSGPPHLLEESLEALSDLPVQVIASTAGQAAPSRIPANARVNDYLPGDDATRLASLVICNGGSLGVYQALASGTPVLGLPSILDQYLNMAYVQQAQAGELLRAGQATQPKIRQAVEGMLAAVSYRLRARQFSQDINQWRGERHFADFLQQTFGSPPQTQAA